MSDEEMNLDDLLAAMPDTMPSKPVVLVLGNSGVGKSHLCIKLCEGLGVPHPFVSGDSMEAITIFDSVDVGEYILVEVGGFFSSRSDDGESVCKMVKFLERNKIVQKVLFVSLNPRLHSPVSLWLERVQCMFREAGSDLVSVISNKWCSAPVTNQDGDVYIQPDGVFIPPFVVAANMMKLHDFILSSTPINVQDKIQIPDLCYKDGMIRQNRGKRIVGTQERDFGQKKDAWDGPFGHILGQKKTWWEADVRKVYDVEVFEEECKVRWDGTKDLNRVVVLQALSGVLDFGAVNIDNV